MSNVFEIVAFGECDREFFGVYAEDEGPVGPVFDIWVQCEEAPMFWKNCDGVYATRHLLLTTTLRHLGVCLKTNVGDYFNHKAFSGDAWEYYLTDGFMI